MNTQDPNNGFEQLGQEARVDARMRTKSYTELEKNTLRERLRDYCASHLDEDGRPLAQLCLAKLVGMAPGTLSGMMTGHHDGGTAVRWRKLDQFLSEEQTRAGRFDGRTYVGIGVSRKMFGVFWAAVRNPSMAAIIGDPGDGKTMTARAFAAQREGVVLLRASEATCSQLGVVTLVHRGLGLGNPSSARHGIDAIVDYLQANRQIMLIIDESQKLSARGLEVVRDIHDLSDPEGRRNVPIVFLGDQDFYRLVCMGRSGERSPMRAQLTRRLYPVLSLEVDGAGEDGRLYSVEDILRMVNASTVRIVDDEAAGWLCELANTRGWGSLGFMTAVAKLGFDLAKRLPVTTDDLRRALTMCIGPRAVGEIDHAAGGRLLTAKVG